MSLHNVTQVAWSKLLVAWDYPVPLGLIFLSSFLLILAGACMSVRRLMESRHHNHEQSS